MCYQRRHYEEGEIGEAPWIGIAREKPQRKQWREGSVDRGCYNKYYTKEEIGYALQLRASGGSALEKKK